MNASLYDPVEARAGNTDLGGYLNLYDARGNCVSVHLPYDDALAMAAIVNKAPAVKAEAA
jgi:hypothetical protein